MLDIICKQVEAAGGDAIVLVDACAIRHSVRMEVNDFLRKTGFPVYAAPMGRTAVDENYERYGGVCISSPSCFTVLPLNMMVVGIHGIYHSTRCEDKSRICKGYPFDRQSQE